jgi:hypothetical protein
MMARLPFIAMFLMLALCHRSPFIPFLLEGRPALFVQDSFAHLIHSYY